MAGIKSTDITVERVELYYLPIVTRVPLKFGPEVVTSVSCARAAVTVRDRNGRQAVGWGETPLSVQWVWPSSLPYELRFHRMKDFCGAVASAWPAFDGSGHPMEIGWDFVESILPSLLKEHNREQTDPLPWLAALLCASVFDQAIHDAFGVLHQIPVYETYKAAWMNRDLSHFLEPSDATVSFVGRYPADFFNPQRLDQLPAWHLVGGLDPVDETELTGKEPKDGHPILLKDWIGRDGLKCLKIKLRGNDDAWDYQRLLKVGQLGLGNGVEWLTADFNCTVQQPAYVNEILDRLKREQLEIFKRLVYVEQPFSYELEEHRLEVHSVSSRKPLFLDESAHDWRQVRLGRELGWTGVALKTCKTQTGALLSACWAQSHGMKLMVQDLTNPMLAQIPHLLLAAHVPTLMGVETNSMQFYPDASAAEAKIHPGVYQRREGKVDLSTVRGPGFGYRLEEIGKVAARCP